MEGTCFKNLIIQVIKAELLILLELLLTDTDLMNVIGYLLHLKHFDLSKVHKLLHEIFKNDEHYHYLKVRESWLCTIYSLYGHSTADILLIIFY